jgi:hypothetical protein
VPEFTAFLAQADTIKILVKGMFDFLMTLNSVPALPNIRITREVLQHPLSFRQPPFAVVRE